TLPLPDALTIFAAAARQHGAGGHHPPARGQQCGAGAPRLRAAADRGDHARHRALAGGSGPPHAQAGRRAGARTYNGGMTTSQDVADTATGLKITVVSDFICPWCYVGLETIDRLWQEWDVTLDWAPYFLDPTIPPEGRTR